MVLLGLINLRGVGESVKANVVLTCIELTGLLIIIMIGAAALGAPNHAWLKPGEPHALTMDASPSIPIEGF